MLEIACPNGAVVLLTSVTQLFGRAQVPADSNVSRDQFEVTSVDGLDDVLQLRILGRNGMAKKDVAAQ